MKPLLTLVLLATLVPAFAGQPSVAPPAPAPAAPTKPAEPAVAWHDVTKWGVEGRAWPDAERLRWFDRLPASAEGKVTKAVWNLSRHSAGMLVRFKTDSPEIWVNYALLSDRMAGSNMTAIGASGVDLYARDEQGKWKWAGANRPASKNVRQSIISGLAPGSREYAMYLPLYNGVESFEVGVKPGANFEPLAPRSEKPIVFYGTSITHGASASRPGMVHTAILGRWLDHPVVNVGFSGNGRMDIEVGEYLSKVDAAVYVIDCLPNMQPADVRKKCAPLVKLLRAAQPQTPIVLVEDRRFANSWIWPSKNQFHTENHAALREAYEGLKKDGVTNLFYIKGDGLIGDDTEGSTDGSHPNDLGFLRQAEVFAPVLKEALSAKGS